MFVLLGALLPHAACRAGDAPSSPPATESRPPENRFATPIRLFASVEEAWAASDADRVASLVDTTGVKIAIKPGSPLAAALTRGAALFLLHDQLRMVQTRSFQMARFQYDPKNRVCRGTALWTGDWGGRQGVRTVRVALTAKPSSAGWLLTEIRAED